MFTMAHPAVAVEQFMLPFLNQWHGGLQPSLTLNDKPNVYIVISYNVSAVLKKYGWKNILYMVVAHLTVVGWTKKKEN